jgi:hypothetical protein
MNHDSSNVGMSQEMAQSAASVGATIKRLVERVTGPLPILGGQGLPSTEGKPGKQVFGVNEDPVLLDRTRHLRKNGEQMIEWFARTSIGAHAVRNSSRDELDKMYKLAISNPENDVPAMFEIRRPPSRFPLKY